VAAERYAAVADEVGGGIGRVVVSVALTRWNNGSTEITAAKVYSLARRR
jgi:hypothetical protein